MSSETPADRPSTSSDDSDQVQPRRALDPGDQQSASAEQDHDHKDAPQSPTTPLRFGDRLASRRRGERSDSGAGRWTWDLPPAADELENRTADVPTAATWDAPDPASGAQPTQDVEAAVANGPSDPPEAASDALPPAEADAPAGSGSTAQPGAPSGGQTDTEPNVQADTEPNTDSGSEGQPDPQPAVKSDDQAAKAGAKADVTEKAAAGPPALPGKQRFKLLQGVGPRATPREVIPDQSHLPANQRMDLAVRITDLSITYRTSFEKKPTLRQAILRLGRGQRAVREIKALQNLTFEVKTGSSIGIIGRNGAGKSTLMRAMAGILPPTSGTIEVWGRASTLLALGVGFNNALSGRENIILGGLAAGLALEQVEDRANEIADWTELGDFIDMPMRTYSSGMASRVAFAVAVHMEPDILMIDEGLSTGDAHFKDKASAKMTELRDKARAMFLVSHGLGSIKELCDEAIWIDKGRLMERGEPEYVIDRYLTHLRAKPNATAFEDL